MIGRLFSHDFATCSYAYTRLTSMARETADLINVINHPPLLRKLSWIVRDTVQAQKLLKAKDLQQCIWLLCLAWSWRWWYKTQVALRKREYSWSTNSIEKGMLVQWLLNWTWINLEMDSSFEIPIIVQSTLTLAW